MSIRRSIAIVAILLGAAPASAAQIDWAAKSEPEATAAATKAWDDSIKEAKTETGTSTEVSAFKVDLNGDGSSEIVGQIKNTYICGNAGPCFFVMTSGGDVIMSVPGTENAEILDSKTGGWLDIQLNDDKKYRYSGGTYRNQ